VPSGDAPALARAITRLAGDAALARSLGQAAREKALAHYDIRATAQTYQALWA